MQLHHVSISNDVSGWSPQVDRNFWGMHHDYVLRTTTAPKDITMEKILGPIKGAISKRGTVALYPLQTGLFQGWTGTMDSLLNVRFTLYCVRLAKQSW